MLMRAKWLPIRLLTNHGSKMAATTAVDAMQTALSCFAKSPRTTRHSNNK